VTLRPMPLVPASPFRRRPGQVALALAAVMAAAALVPSSAPAAAKPRCGDDSWRLVAAGEDVSVWRTRFKAEHFARYYACYRSRKSPTALGTSHFDRRPGVFRFAAKWLAFANLGCGRGDVSCRGHVVLADTARRRVRRVAFPENSGGIAGLGVTQDGALGWMWLAQPFEAILEIWALDSGGQRMLARGNADELPPSGFAVAEAAVYWTASGAAMSAPFQR
jgi:hypothetical protein